MRVEGTSPAPEQGCPICTDHKTMAGAEVTRDLAGICSKHRDADRSPPGLDHTRMLALTLVPLAEKIPAPLRLEMTHAAEA